MRYIGKTKGLDVLRLFDELITAAYPVAQSFIISTIYNDLFPYFEYLDTRQIFVHAGIFFSRALDTGEASFRLGTGDAAGNKGAGHDIKNQKMIQLLGE